MTSDMERHDRPHAAHRTSQPFQASGMIEEQLFEYLRAHGPATPHELAEALHWPYAVVLIAVETLCCQGVATEVRDAYEGSGRLVAGAGAIEGLRIPEIWYG